MTTTIDMKPITTGDRELWIMAAKLPPESLRTEASKVLDLAQPDPFENRFYLVDLDKLPSGAVSETLERLVGFGYAQRQPESRRQLAVEAPIYEALLAAIKKLIEAILGMFGGGGSPSAKPQAKRSKGQLRIEHDDDGYTP